MRPINKFFFALLFAPFILGNLYAQNTGSTNPTYSISSPPSSCPNCAGALWTNENNANTQDNNYTEANLEPYLFCWQSTCYRSRYLYCSDFNFSIPTTATIQGIKLKVRGKCDTPNAGMDSTIKLAINSAPVGVNKAAIPFWSTNNSNLYYGDNLDLWNYNWTPANINDSTFGVFIKVYNATASNIKTSIDLVSITVYYSLTTGVLESQTSSPGNFNANYSSAEQTINVVADADNQKTKIVVSNILGQVVFTKETQGDISENINANSFKEGIYFVSLIADNKVQTKKIIISR